MPPNRHVILFDDSIENRKIDRRLLENGNLTVIGEAGSIDALERLVESLKRDMLSEAELIALLDDNAPWYDNEGPDPKGVGREAERIVKGCFPNAITVATTSAGNVNVGYGDYRYQSGAGSEELSVFVNSLPAKER